MECNTWSLERAKHLAGIVNAGSSTEWEGQLVWGVCVHTTPSLGATNLDGTSFCSEKGM